MPRRNEPLSEDQKQKMRATIAARGGRRGPLNPRWGKTVDVATKEKVRGTIAAKGGRSGHRNAHWKRGYYISHGYMWILRPEHHRARHNGYVKRAVLVLEAKLRRPLRDLEYSHHVDGNKLNDRPENLEAMTSLQHKVHHATQARDGNGKFL